MIIIKSTNNPIDDAKVIAGCMINLEAGGIYYDGGKPTNVVKKGYPTITHAVMSHNETKTLKTVIDENPRGSVDVTMRLTRASLVISDSNFNVMLVHILRAFRSMLNDPRLVTYSEEFGVELNHLQVPSVSMVEGNIVKRTISKVDSVFNRNLDTNSGNKTFTLSCDRFTWNFTTPSRLIFDCTHAGGLITLCSSIWYDNLNVMAVDKPVTESNKDIFSVFRHRDRIINETITYTNRVHPLMAEVGYRDRMNTYTAIKTVYTGEWNKFTTLRERTHSNKINKSVDICSECCEWLFGDVYVFHQPTRANNIDTIQLCPGCGHRQRLIQAYNYHYRVRHPNKFEDVLALTEHSEKKKEIMLDIVNSNYQFLAYSRGGSDFYYLVSNKYVGVNDMGAFLCSELPDQLVRDKPQVEFYMLNFN